MTAAISLPDYTVTQALRGTPFPAIQVFVPTLDEIYVPVVLRKPPGEGPFPVITMGRGDGRGGMPHVLAEVERLVPMQDEMIRRGYAVVYVNYRHEIPRLYGRRGDLTELEDDMSGGENRRLKSAATLDSDDLAAVWRYLADRPWVKPGAIGALGISHGGEMILKAAASGAPLAAGVIAEGASHEFLSVNTGPSAPRNGGELQYQDIDIVRSQAEREAAFARIRRISAPMLHLSRAGDHLQGIFELAHEWMAACGKDTTLRRFSHPDHGFSLIYDRGDRRFEPDPVQREAFELAMAFFHRHLGA
jgi:dienelactone hydrolase